MSPRHRTTLAALAGIVLALAACVPAATAVDETTLRVGHGGTFHLGEVR